MYLFSKKSQCTILESSPNTYFFPMKGVTLFRIKIRTITSKIIFVSLRYRVMYMKHTCLFWLIIPIVITVLISSTTTSGYSSTLENNPVLQQAQKSLEANQKKLGIVSPEPVPNVVPSASNGFTATVWWMGYFLLGL